MTKKNPNLRISSRAAALGAALVLLPAQAGSLSNPSNASGAGLIVAPILATGEKAPQLFRMSPDGTGLVQLTKGTGVGLPTDCNDFPVLSRDRKTLVFASGRDFPHSTPGGNPMLRLAYVMDASGGSAHRLTNHDANHYIEYPDDISPDGTWVALHVINDGTNLPAPLQGISELYMAKVDGSSCVMLIPHDPLSQGEFNLGSATFTRDGKTLLFLAAGGNSCEIWKLDLATQQTTQITHEAKANSSVVWRIPMISPGNDKVYFQVRMDDPSGSSMKVINLDGTGETSAFTIPLDPVNGGVMEDRFALSPAGDAFVFANGSGEQSLQIKGLDGADPRTILPAAPFIGFGTLTWR